MAEKVLTYNKSIVTQGTGFWCGPATVQNILSNRNISRSEASLASRMGTTVNGTDHIGLLSGVLNAELPAAKYVVVTMPNDPPTAAQREALWQNVVSSIDAGYGVAVNIIAPPGNYPLAVAPSTINFAYSGGTVYHYVAIMGYSDSGGVRKFWMADSGFYPYGGWVSAAQMATLIPPKGYAYATAKAATPAPAQPDASMDSILAALGRIEAQLGPKLPAWGDGSSFGKNVDGTERTLRDGLIAELADIKARLGRIGG